MPKTKPKRKKLAEEITPIAEDKKQPDSVVRIVTEQTGSSGTEIYSGYFSEEYLATLRGPQAAEVWDKMRRSESQVAMLMGAIKNPIKSAMWEVEPADDSEVSKLHADFIKKNLFESLEQGWENFLHEALTFIDFGFSMFEVVHKVIFGDPKFGAYNGINVLGFRGQKTVEAWNLEKKTGKLLSVQQMAQGDVGDNVTIPGEFLLVFTNQKEGDNYEGISALRPLYGPYLRKQVYHKLVAIGLEKYAIGTPVGTIPKGKEAITKEVNKFEAILRAYTSHEKAYIMLSEGWKIEIARGDFDASKVKEIISFENTEMAKALVANFLELASNTSSGGFALGKDLSDFFTGGIQSYANIISDGLNRILIPGLIKLKYGKQAAYPKLKCTGIADKAGKELAEIVAMLVAQKAINPDEPLEDALRKLYALPKKSLVAAQQQTTPPPTPSSAITLAEGSIKLADAYRNDFKKNSAGLKILMQTGLAKIRDGLKSDIERNFKAATPANKIASIKDVSARGVSEYKTAIKQYLGEVAQKSLEAARKEVPKAKNVKLAGYDDLPSGIRKHLGVQADLIANTQVADIEKVTFFQFTSSAGGTDNIETILFDIDQATDKVLQGSTATGMSVDVAAADAIAVAVNVARNEFFFSDEVAAEIEAMEFVNEDPVSEICQDLNGTIFDMNDPGIERYAPPLHHNCKSRLVPVLKGSNVEKEMLRPSSSKLEKFITLAEKKFTD